MAIGKEESDLLIADDKAITGELVMPPGVAELEAASTSDAAHKSLKSEIAAGGNQRLYFRYIALPAIFLTVALLGGMRLGADGGFIFLRPPLFCLIAASVLLILFFRARLIEVSGWFSEAFSSLKNVANASVMLTLFAASTQIFNSLLPESGLMFWVVAFCFFWTLWNNLFSDFDTKRLIHSLGALFGLAFVVKYLLLGSIGEPSDKSWIRALIEDPVKETAASLLDIPRFSAGTGYIQFFAVAMFLLGLYVLPPTADDGEPR